MVPEAIKVDDRVQCPACNRLLTKFGYPNHYRFNHLGLLSPFDRNGTHYQKTAWNSGLKGDPRLSQNGANHFAKGEKFYQEHTWNKGLTKLDPRISIVGSVLGGKNSHPKLKRWIEENRDLWLQNCREGGLESYKKHPFVSNGCKGKWRLDSFGKKVYLQSSYEVRLSYILDSGGIPWTRPEVKYYEVDGKKKSCFLDFFLPNQNLYLDPKNSYLIEKDLPKMEFFSDYFGIRIVLVELRHLENPLNLVFFLKS